MSNFLNILYPSVSFSKEKDRHASKRGGWGISIISVTRVSISYWSINAY